ncbi:uncharacterized protein C7orf78 homolog [Discoglossus pictus]
MLSNKSSSPENEHSYLFANQVGYTANESLTFERSKTLVKPRDIPESDIWIKKPPDFSVKLYKSFKMPRKSDAIDENHQRKKIQLYKKANELQRIEDNHLPILVKKEELNKFQTKFKNVGPFEASLMFVKNGVYPKDKYKDPKPHDFRQYETGIPDFETNYFRDPFNLRFKSQHLSFVYGLQPSQEERNHAHIKKLILHKHQDPKWESSLILPKSPWPPKSASYTRYRRRRGVYTAFMDRVEEKFNASIQELSQ